MATKQESLAFVSVRSIHARIAVYRIRRGVVKAMLSIVDKLACCHRQNGRKLLCANDLRDPTQIRSLWIIQACRTRLDFSYTIRHAMRAVWARSLNSAV